MTHNYELDETEEAPKGTSRFTACECWTLSWGGIKGTKMAIQDGRPTFKHTKKKQTNPNTSRI